MAIPSSFTVVVDRRPSFVSRLHRTGPPSLAATFLACKLAMSKAGPSTNAHGSLLELKAITAEHADRFAKEGKQAVRGGPRTRGLDVKSKSKDQFDRPSPGLVKRLAREAKADAKKRHFADDGSGVSEEQRRAIMEAKAKKYEALKRGDVSGFSERELAEANIDVRWISG